MSSPTYAELVSTSNFSFLRGGSHPDELVMRAASLGLAGLGLCDRNTFAGVVRAHAMMREIEKTYPDFRYLVGVRLVFADATPDIVAYPMDRNAYGRLCQLLSLGNRRAEKGNCILRFDDLADFAEGQLFIVLPEANAAYEVRPVLEALKRLAPGRVHLGIACRLKGDDRARLNEAAALAHDAGVPLLAHNDVLYHDAGRRPLQDVLTAIRDHVTIASAGRRLEQNAERHLKPPAEMARLFHDHPAALAETARVISRITFSLDDLRYNYPEETVGNGETAQQTLERLTWAGAKKRYPEAIPFKVKRMALKELKLIADKRYAAYFLTVADLIRYAREERGILCQGRGSAANSTVCFCLGVTEVDPMVGNLVFGRFISTERDEPPDIDVDFEHERREEVIQYLYQKYGRHRAALTATVVTYRTRGAIREIGKVFGLSADLITALNGLNWGWHTRGIKGERLRDLGLDPDEPTLKLVIELVSELIGFPRHLSQHVGGFVLTGDRLDASIPIHNAAMEGRTTVEWDKDDLDTLGILKVDVLALGMLSCIRRGFELMRLHYGQDLSLAGILRDQDARVYEMIQRADTLGTFQIESRAQMSMLPRLRPTEFYDLVIEVAIVRPGPIQGGMVHPYLKRRQGIETPETVGPALDAVLKRTLGIPLFQEQAMQIAIVAGGFTPGEADQLRRAMATFRRTGTIGKFRDKLTAGMLKKGYSRDFAERCFHQIEGFADYGFPESHAASFALLVYVSAWLKCHYPDVFAAALLNSQPMGFYAPAQIVRDALEHGVEIREPDINFSELENGLEPGRPVLGHVWDRHAGMAGDIRTSHAVRLGFSRVKGLKQADAALIVARRGKGYDSVRDLWLRTGLGSPVLERLAEADLFASLGLSRRDALWAVRGLRGTDGAETLPLFAAASQRDPRREPDAGLPPMPPGEEVIHDYRHLGLSLKAHPASFVRDGLRARRTLTCAELGATGHGHVVEVAGLVLVRQRPGTASGVVFLTLEDETGIANIIVWPKVFETCRQVVLGGRFVAVKGQVQREGLVVHLVARSMTDLTAAITALSDEDPTTRHAPEALGEGRTPPENPWIAKDAATADRAERAARAALPSGRNFH